MGILISVKDQSHTPEPQYQHAVEHHGIRGFGIEEDPVPKEDDLNAKVPALLISILGFAALSGCGGDPQARGANSAKAEGRSGEPLTLEVGGSPGTDFSGTCAVGDAKPEELDGQTPRSFTYDLLGKPLECEIASEDDVEVTLIHDNNRSVQRISGGTLNLTYDNGSISSSTSSSSGSSSSSQVVSSSGATDEEPADATNGSAGNVESETRDVSGFDEVELSGVGSLSISQTGTESLSVEAEEDVLPKIRTEVVDGRLVIGPEPDTSIETTEPINYALTVDNLGALTLSGSGDVDAEGIDTDELVVDVSGSGAMKARGRAESQEAHVSGSGSYEAEDLESRRVRIDVEGAGSAVVNASEELDAKVGGAGSVEYVGDPTVEEDVSGVGRVSKH